MVMLHLSELIISIIILIWINFIAALIKKNLIAALKIKEASRQPPSYENY